MFISFTHRMSSFIPTERERERTMSGFFCLVQLGVLFFFFFRLVGFCLCKSAYEFGNQPKVLEMS